MSAQIPDTHVDLLTRPHLRHFDDTVRVGRAGKHDRLVLVGRHTRPRQYGRRTPQTQERARQSKSGPDGLGSGGCIPLDRCTRRR